VRATRSCPRDVIRDYGGRDETFEVAEIDPPALVYRSRRNATEVTWSIPLAPAGGGGPGRTRVHLRLRMAPVRHKRIVRTAGELLDLLTVAGMAAGLRERLAENAPSG
jgi:hypothetical protein